MCYSAIQMQNLESVQEILVIQTRVLSKRFRNTAVRKALANNR